MGRYIKHDASVVMVVLSLHYLDNLCQIGIYFFSLNLSLSLQRKSLPAPARKDFNLKHLVC